MHFADSVTEVAHMENLSVLPASTGASQFLRPVISRRFGQEPVVLGTLTYVYVPTYATGNTPSKQFTGTTDS